MQDWAIIRSIRKGIENLNNTVSQFDLIDVFFYSITAEYVFFSSSHGTFTKIECMK